MTAMDRAGMAIAIAIAAVAVAFASYASVLQSEGPSGITTPQITQQQKGMQEEKAVESQKTMEEAMEEQREEMMEVKETEKEPEPEAVEVTISEAEEVPKMTEGPKTVTVSAPSGTSVPGCEETDTCYIPSSVDVNVGDTVSWSNDDSAAHTVTSGTPVEGPDGNFDSSLFMAGATYEVTFDTAGEYQYFCMVHPWMVGTVNVS